MKGNHEMTTVIKQTYETQIFINEDGDVSILQLGSGFDAHSSTPPDQIISFPAEHLDAVIQALQTLKA